LGVRSGDSFIEGFAHELGHALNLHAVNG